METQIFYLINHLPHNPFFDGLARAIHYLTFDGKLYFILVLLFLALKKPRLRLLAGLGTASAALTYLVNDLFLKETFIRARPYQALWDAVYIPSAPENYSFPSGQAAVAFALATVCFYVFPKSQLRFWALGIASLIAISRVYMGHHYPSDVLTGAVVGTTISFFVFYIWKTKINKQRNQN